MNFFDWYFLFIAFFMGACWGSFLNVCIFRIPAEKSVVHPRSSCPKCGYMIPWYDNIPILSWILLRAKCRQCREPISGRYPLVELLTALLFAWIWLRFPYPDGLLFIPYWIMTFGLILGSFVDIDEMWLPDRTTIGGMIIGVVLSGLFPAMHAYHGLSGRIVEWALPGLQNVYGISFLKSVLGMGFGFGVLWLVSVIGRAALKKDAMGFGDVKLMGALGAFLGSEAVIFIVFISSLLGSIIGVSLIVAGRKDWQEKIPFGPYIALAAVIWVLGGSAWWGWYLNWLTAVY